MQNAMEKIEGGRFRALGTNIVLEDLVEAASQCLDDF